MRKSVTGLDQKLLSYSLTAGIVLASQSLAKADVIVIDSGQGLPYTLTPGVPDAFDINFDGDPDVDIRIRIPNGYSYMLLAENASGGASFRGYQQGSDFFAYVLNSGDIIPANAPGANWDGNGVAAPTTIANHVVLAYSGGGVGQWNGTNTATNNGVTNKYLGVKFNIGGSTHYGWVYMSTTPSGGNIGATINAFAYETTPNTGINPIVLPVELTAFSAVKLNNGIKLNWTTATEVNNYGFEIERSKDSKIEKNWEKVGFISGNGNSNSVKEYTFTDANPGEGDFYYRLKQIDNDGAFSYSKELLVNVSSPIQFALGQNYPNPFNPATSIHFTIPESGETTLKVFNSLGEEVADLVNGFLEAGIYSVNFNAGELASGVYVYRLEVQGKFSAEKKMNLIK